MRKILITLITLLIVKQIAYAEYQPIPSQQSNVYKTEIEFLINRKVPYSKHLIKKLPKEINRENNEYKRLLIVEQGIPTILFEFYQELVNTTEKYTSIKKDIPATDWYGELKKNLDPYLKDNNVNTKKIDKLLDYAQRQQLQIEKKYCIN